MRNRFRVTGLTGLVVAVLVLVAGVGPEPPAVGAAGQPVLPGGSVQPASERLPYADVCDDAGDSPLDLRGAGIQRQTDALVLTLYTCDEWGDSALEGSSLRWELSDGTTDTRVTVTRSDGALTWTATRSASGQEVGTAEGSAERTSVFGEQRGVRARVPLDVLGLGHSFTFSVTVHDDGGPTPDRMPDSGEPPLSYPDPCPELEARAVVTTQAGRYPDALAGARAAGLRVTDELPELGAFAVEGPAAGALTAVERLPGVATAERPAPVQRLAVTPDDPEYPAQWSLPEVGAPRAWRVRTVSGLRVAVIDDGVDATRVDLAGRVTAGHDTRFDRPLRGGTSSDRGGHGTAVASVLAAEGDNAVDLAGVDWGATIVPYRMFDAAGCGDDVHVAAALTRGADAGIPVLSLSVGTTDDTTVLRDAVRYAHRRGSVLIAAAGNVAQTGNAPMYPASYPEAVGVGATLRGGEIAPYSNTNTQVHVVAPGGRGNDRLAEDLLTLGERSFLEPAAGTSFAVPIVAGGVALYRAVDAGGTPQTVADALAETAVDRGPAGRDDAYGHGLVDLYRLLLQAGENRACPPDGVPSAGFTDVAAGTVHTAAIDCVVWWDVARGVTRSEYRPARSVTRAQMATFIARAVETTDTPLPVTGDHFPDDDGNPHEANVNKLAAAGIVAGRNGRYWPNEAVTRDQMATFLVRAFEHVAGEELPDGDSPFTDIAGNTHATAIERAYESGFVRGRTTTSYDPRSPVRRDQMATFLRNVLGGFARHDLADPPA